MFKSEYDGEQSQIHIADDFGQMVTLSREQAFVLFRWLSSLFSQCQGCDQLVSPASIQTLTYLREIAPFRVQTAWLCSDCYREMLATSVHSSSQQ